MKTLFIKGHKVQIFPTYLGAQLFIFDGKGNQIYAHRVSANPIARAEQIIDQQ